MLKWWYFEVTWDTYVGCHGPYGTVEDVVARVAHQQKPDGHTFKIFDTFVYKPNMDVTEYLRLCNYNFEWGVVVVEHFGLPHRKLRRPLMAACGR